MELRLCIVGQNVHILMFLFFTFLLILDICQCFA